jgi:transcription elongation factor GreA
MAEVSYYTQEGYEKLKEKLDYLKNQRRKEVADAIASAREQGDLRENAEYDAAKEEQGKLEAEIAQLEETLANARILDESSMDTSKAFVLSTVRVRNKKMNKEFSYTLVSPEEADIKKGKISTESPIGKALLGHEVGEVVTADAPAGPMELEILDISR